MSNSYAFLSEYYDGFSSQDCDYVSWSQYLLSRANGAVNAADIACGTGKMTKLLVQAGLNVTATDVSAEMLNVAARNCRATFVLQDMRAFRLLRKTDMAVCVNDGVNYLSPAELLPFFKRVADNLECGAPFIFDVSSEYKLTKIIGNNVFYDDGDDVTLLWTNKLSRGSVKMDITLFVKDGEKYKRFDESHVQYVHRQADIEQALKDAGFELKEVTADYGNLLSPTSPRITFYATKLPTHKSLVHSVFSPLR